MKVKNKRLYYLKRKSTKTDAEANKFESFGAPVPVYANISPASGKLQAEIYGARLGYILNMLYDGTEKISEGDGVCVYVDKNAAPDYRVISVKRWAHMQIELEKII